VIKQILYLDNPIHRAIYDKEISALKKLRSSANIVQLLDHDYGRTKSDGVMMGLIYLEYVNGDTLYNRNYDISKIVDKYSIIKQIVTALRCAHDNGIIHRDVNPQNIMITEDLEVKLIDFGICKVKGLSQKGTTYQYATNRYAAPEVCYHSENASERSDIYSLGAVIYFMFTNNEPPLPEAFESTIYSSSGIDIQLKDILKTMVSVNPEDRFESIIDLEIALSPLYLKFLNNGERYIVEVPSETLKLLLRRSLVCKLKKHAELFMQDIPANFSDTYVRSELTEGILYYIFDGINYSMYCLYEHNRFQVVYFKNLDVYFREKNKKLSIPISGQILFKDSYSHSSISNNNFEITNRISDHMEMLRSKRNINIEYDNAFGFWRDFIAAMIADAKKQALRFNYENYIYRNGKFQFKLNRDSCFGDESISTETKFVYETTNKKGELVPVEIGTFDGYENDGNTIVIKASNHQRKNQTIPRKGQFCVDYRKEISQYRKQDQALDEFRREETNNNRNLKGVFIGLEEPTAFYTGRKVQFYNKKLDATQQKAVTKILSAQDIALIQGPPGTGKTNVLVEVIRQLLKFNRLNPLLAQKILIVSQSHAAVDKILEDLDPFISNVNTIRIGNDEKLSELAKKKYSLENRKKLWIEAIIRKSEDSLISQLENLNIEKNDFNLFAEYLERSQVKNNTQDDKETLQVFLDSFYTKYNLNNDNSIIKKLIIQFQWISRLNETQDLDEYFIKNATIVAGTCSGFASNLFISDINFDYVFVDEAAKATYPEIMMSLIKAKKVVLVGDHKQLPPVFDQEAISRYEKKINIADLKNSGFGKIFDALPESCKETLTTQYRMHPCIGNMISHIFYNDTIQNGISIEERTLEIPSLKNKSMVWVSTSQLPREKRMEIRIPTANGNSSFQNPTEVKIIQDFIKALDSEIGEKGYSIGVITPYRAQLDLIQRRIKSLEIKNVNVEINTVDAFQGSQKDIILYSTVRSGIEPTIGFLREHARLNVSFSRAKSLLIIVGDLEFLNNERIKDNKFPEIIQHIESNGDFCKIMLYRSE
jgi:predicted DNA helicase